MLFIKVEFFLITDTSQNGNFKKPRANSQKPGVLNGYVYLFMEFVEEGRGV
jgi:hypothetical protein